MNVGIFCTLFFGVSNDHLCVRRYSFYCRGIFGIVFDSIDMLKVCCIGWFFKGIKIFWVPMTSCSHVMTWIDHLEGRFWYTWVLAGGNLKIVGLFQGRCWDRFINRQKKLEVWSLNICWHVSVDTKVEED